MLTHPELEIIIEEPKSVPQESTQSSSCYTRMIFLLIAGLLVLLSVGLTHCCVTTERRRMLWGCKPAGEKEFEGGEFLFKVNNRRGTNKSEENSTFTFTSEKVRNTAAQVAVGVGVTGTLVGLVAIGTVTGVLPAFGPLFYGLATVFGGAGSTLAVSAQKFHDTRPQEKLITYTFKTIEYKKEKRLMVRLTRKGKPEYAYIKKIGKATLNYMDPVKNSVVFYLKSFKSFLKGGKMCNRKINYNDHGCHGNRFKELIEAFLSGGNVDTQDIWCKKSDGEDRIARCKWKDNTDHDVKETNKDFKVIFSTKQSCKTKYYTGGAFEIFENKKEVEKEIRDRELEKKAK